nr:TOBE domain-containing protein [Nitratireductor luteus]
MSEAADGRYLVVARPENLGIRKASGAPGEGEVAGRVRSLQFQGYRTSYRVVLCGGEEVNVETFGELAATPLGRGDEVIISFNDKCLFVPEASS